MDNTVIKVLDTEHSKKVIEFFKSKGVNTLGYKGHSINSYYGVIKGKFNFWYNLPSISTKDINIIELPEEPFKERVMLVSNNNNSDWYKRVVFAKKKNKYIAWNRSETLKESKNSLICVPWEYAKELPKKEIVELTIQDISDGKGVGIAPHLIRIKK